jgi:hypothetical protein
MNKIDTPFEILNNRQPTDNERKRLLKVGKALQIQDNDAVWLIFLALDYYESLYKNIPEQIKECTNTTLSNMNITANKFLKSTVEKYKADIDNFTSHTSNKIANNVIKISNNADKIADNATKTSNEVNKIFDTINTIYSNIDKIADNNNKIASKMTKKDKLIWPCFCLVTIVVGLIFFYFALAKSYDEGVKAGYSKAYEATRQERYAAEWGNSAEGQLAFEMSQQENTIFYAYQLFKAGSLERLANCTANGWRIEKKSCLPYAAKDGYIYGWPIK